MNSNAVSICTFPNPMTIEQMRAIDALKTYKELEAAKQRIAQLEREVALFHEHASIEDICVVQCILAGEEIP